MTITDPVEAPAPTATDDDLTHMFCPCSPDWSLCGQDVSDVEAVSEWADEDECVVCLDLEWQPCPRCGT